MPERIRTYIRKSALWSMLALLVIIIAPAPSSHVAQAATTVNAPSSHIARAAMAVPATSSSESRAETSLFTFTVFTNSSQSNMYVYQSNDGLKFYQLAGPAYTPPTGLVRDPSIMHHDGRYYVTYTTNWTGNMIGVASSPDRIHWTFLENITLPATVFVAWAPEWFIDTNGSVNIIVNLNSTDTGDANFIPQKITALNHSLTSWSSPTPLIGLGPNYIDLFVVKVGNTYHAFVKNETTKYIEHATATKLTGPYTFVGTGNWAGWGNNLEGPALFQLDNGSWRIFMDGYTTGTFYYSDSADNFQTWTPKTQLLNGMSGFVRHGTVLRETDSHVNVGIFNPNSRYKLISVHSGKALDVYNSSQVDGGTIDQWSDTGGTNQQWELVSATGSYFKLVSVNSGKVLEVHNSSTADGGTIDQWTDTGGENQQWTLILVSGSYYKLINRNSGKALDVYNASTSDGAPIDQWDDNGGANQQWRLIQVA